MPHKMTPDDAYAAPIEELDLKVRLYNCLKRSQINKVGQLLSMRREEILALRNLTPTSFEEIQKQLIAHGLMSPTQLLGPFAQNDQEHKGE